MSPFGAAVLGVVAVAIGFAWVVVRLERLTLFAPGSSGGLGGSAATFCLEGCRLPNGTCPLTGEGGRARDCPLWRFVGADVPTQAYGSPFERLAPR